jgi:hypothetical protein
MDAPMRGEASGVPPERIEFLASQFARASAHFGTVLEYAPIALDSDPTTWPAPELVKPPRNAPNPERRAYASVGIKTEPHRPCPNDGTIEFRYYSRNLYSRLLGGTRVRTDRVCVECTRNRIRRMNAKRRMERVG